MRPILPDAPRDAASRQALERISVLLADDHAIVTEGLYRVLEPEFDVVGVVADGRALVEAAMRLTPNAIVADVSMPLLNGIDAARLIRQTDRNVKIIFLTMHPDVVYALEAFGAGASAYVLKSSAGTEIVTAVREALRGRTYVTPALNHRLLEKQTRGDRPSDDTVQSLPPRQRQVVQLVAEGQTTKQIAAVLQISPRTVEFHRYRAMEALGIHSIAELVQYAIKHQLILP
jgi:DNA-binding NarL/FixJ family response regulator